MNEARAGRSDDDVSPAPLAGLRVLDLSRILAGPWIAQTLADLGADVVKIESPAGDDTRQWGPPWLDEPGGGRTAAYFHACNRGKRSVVADLAKPDDLALVKALAADADVLVENFRVGGLAKFGLDHPSLSATNPRLVYCSVTGFGQDGPYAHRAGYDFMIQGMAGIMSLTGAPDGDPQKIGVAFADLFTALYGVIGIQAALARREATGRGELVDMALLDAMSGVLANQAMNFLVTGTAPTRMGNAHPNIAPYQTFETADGHLIVAVGNDAQFGRLCGVLGLDELARRRALPDQRGPRGEPRDDDRGADRAHPATGARRAADGAGDGGGARGADQRRGGRVRRSAGDAPRDADRRGRGAGGPDAGAAGRRGAGGGAAAASARGAHRGGAGGVGETNPGTPTTVTARLYPWNLSRISVAAPTPDSSVRSWKNHFRATLASMTSFTDGPNGGPDRAGPRSAER